MSDNIETVEIHGESSVDWQSTAMQYIELNKQKTEAIQRVWDLHTPIKSLNGFGPEACKQCSELTTLALGYANYVVYGFCLTIKALDGEQND
jgi:hypothetical protein